MSPRTDVVAILALGFSACGTGEAPRGPGGTPLLSRALSEHGVVLGQAVPEVALGCSDGVTRHIGEKGAYQLVTFATPFDCVMCNLHIASLGDVPWNTLPELDPIVVAWSPAKSDRDHLSVGGGDEPVMFPVCIDEAGVLWDSLNVSHTPFTVLVEDGRVIYLEDRNLARLNRQEEFLADLARLIRQPELAPAR